MNIEKIKELIRQAVAECREDIISLGESILAKAEVGYREVGASALIRRVFDGLEIEYQYPLAVTGIKAKLYGRSHKYNVAIMGELDALFTQYANPAPSALCLILHSLRHK